MALKVKQGQRSNEQKLAAIEEATKEDLVALNMRIPLSLHRKIKMKAVEEGHNVTIKAIVLRAVDEYFQNCPADHEAR